VDTLDRAMKFTQTLNMEGGTYKWMRTLSEAMGQHRFGIFALLVALAFQSSSAQVPHDRSPAPPDTDIGSWVQYSKKFILSKGVDEFSERVHEIAKPPRLAGENGRRQVIAALSLDFYRAVSSTVSDRYLGLPKIEPLSFDKESQTGQPGQLKRLNLCLFALEKPDIRDPSAKPYSVELLPSGAKLERFRNRKMVEAPALAKFVNQMDAGLLQVPVFRAAQAAVRIHRDQVDAVELRNIYQSLRCDIARAIVLVQAARSSGKDNDRRLWVKQVAALEQNSNMRSPFWRIVRVNVERILSKS
jgi:hypothetical protein